MALTLSSRELKQNTALAHEQLYRNIKLLTFVYPCSRDFKDLFNENVFMKSNNAAFQHVIYYLFNILNPKLTKEKITTWPLLEAKQESSFRNEVVAFIGIINSKYDYPEIPHLMVSQLITPGGYKFIRFMLKLSNIVLYEHLKKTQKSEMMGPIRPHESVAVTNIIINNLKTRTQLTREENINLLKNFNNVVEKSMGEADLIVAELQHVEVGLANKTKALKNKKCRNGETVEDLTQKLNIAQKKMAHIENIKKLCNIGCELLMYLNSEKLVLEFKKHEFVVPDGVKHLFKDTATLDVCELYNSLRVLLENDCTELPNFAEEVLNDLIILFEEMNAQCMRLDKHLSAGQQELEGIIQSFTINPCKNDSTTCTTNVFNFL